MKKQITLFLSLFVVIFISNAQELSRTNWTVTTQTGTGYTHVPDGTTGLPEHLFDDNANTFLSLVKPGKSFAAQNIEQQPSGIMPTITIDFKTEQTFDSLKWRHRGNHSYNYLRVYAVQLEGGNNGTDFAKIGPDTLWIPNAAGYVGSVIAADLNYYAIKIPSSSYRYLRVRIMVWSDIYNGQHPNFVGTGATLGSSIQIAEIGLSRTQVTSAPNILQKNIEIYPTKAQKGEVITVNQLSNNLAYNTTVYTVGGTKVYEQKNASGTTSFQLQNSGVYLVKINNGVHSLTQRILIQ